MLIERSRSAFRLVDLQERPLAAIADPGLLLPRQDLALRGVAGLGMPVASRGRAVLEWPRGAGIPELRDRLKLIR